LEGGSNTCAVALRDVGGDEKETQSLGIYLGHPVPAGYEYGDLALQVEGVSNLRQYSGAMSLARLGPDNDCAGEGQHQL
jgi:hypothetical protein